MWDSIIEKKNQAKEWHRWSWDWWCGWWNSRCHEIDDADDEIHADAEIHDDADDIDADASDDDHEIDDDAEIDADEIDADDEIADHDDLDDAGIDDDEILQKYWVNFLSVEEVHWSIHDILNS